MSNFWFYGRADVEMSSVPVGTEKAIRYERGSQIYAIDGLIGTLKQVVVDEEKAEVKALVVRVATRKESVLVPPDLVEKCVGGALQLSVTQEQFARGASRSPRFESRMFTGADTETIAKAIPMMFRGDARRSVVRISRDRVDTADSPTNSPANEPPQRRSWKRIFSRGRSSGEVAQASLE